MFGSKSNGSTNGKGEVSSGTNIIVVGTVIKGDILSKSDTRIDGNLEGDLKCSARLLLGQKGKVNGNIQSNEAIIEGNILGNISISGILTLKSTAQIKGDIYTKKLIVESGAVINGQCSMDADGQYKDENGKEKEKPSGKKEKSSG
ncbi:MAG: polymer-forming cytoskeletal protein [Bacteroidetes bacterium]|jgi:cytoskeletal protein CcmA (bactofilin family)|nr:polymer-forming cytoskeletal protein [Bacteroidota bacterium]